MAIDDAIKQIRYVANPSDDQQIALDVLTAETR